MALEDMSDFDRQAWDDLIRRRDRFLNRSSRRLIPERVREGVGRAGKKVANRAREVPGADQVEHYVIEALEGGLEVVSRSTLWSLSGKRVTDAYTQQGLDVARVSDIRSLELIQLDKVRPRMVGKYMAASGASGAGAGFIISGGEIMAVVGAAGGGAAGAPAGGVGAAPGAGAGAGPGLATVAGAMAADAAATMFSAIRLIFETASYYGYDPQRPEERLRAMGVLNVATAFTQSGKTKAYLQLNELVKLLVRNATWTELGKNRITQVVQYVFARLTERLTKKKLAAVIPLLGIAIGGGLNALTMSRVGDAADFLYREQFLRDKYDLGYEDTPDSETKTDEDVVDAEVVDEEEIPIADIVEDEIEAAEREGEFVLQFPPRKIESLAERFSYPSDTGAAVAGAAARERGYYELDELITVCGWKTARSKKHVAANSSPAVEKATRVALDPLSSERERMKALTGLGGVAVPTASALLHFAFPEDYPILDVRALQSPRSQRQGGHLFNRLLASLPRGLPFDGHAL